MAQTKRKSEWVAEPTPAAATKINPALATPGSARALQQLLEDHTATIADEERWSRRRSLAFIVTITASLWLGIIEAIHGMLRLGGW